MDSEFPGNSHATRRNETQEPVKSEATSEPKEVKKVVSGKVTERPKPIGKRLKTMFINDGGGFVDHLIDTIVVPMAKDMLLTVVKQVGDGLASGFEEMIYGPSENGRRRSPLNRGPSGRTVINYNHVASSNTRRSADRPPYSRSVSRRSNDVKDLIVESRATGEMVIEELEAMIDADGSGGYCTVGDYYSIMDLVPVSTDQEWGWTDLREARVNRVSENEFLISMPRPKQLRFR